MEQDDLEQFDTACGNNNKVLTRKHLAERQRRARINSYLEEIERLTAPYSSQTGPAKLEKAEVLERAVNFLQQTNKAEPQKDPNNNVEEKEEEAYTDIVTAYKSGFNLCLARLCEHLGTDQGLQEEVGGLKEHLVTFLQTLTSDVTDNMAAPNQSYDAYHSSMQSDQLIQMQSSYSQFPNGYNNVNHSNNQTEPALPNVSAAYSLSQESQQYNNTGCLQNNYDSYFSGQQHHQQQQQQQPYHSAQSPHIQALQLSMQSYFHNTNSVDPDECSGAKEVMTFGGVGNRSKERQHPSLNDSANPTSDSGVTPSFGQCTFAQSGPLNLQQNIASASASLCNKKEGELAQAGGNHTPVSVWRPW